MIGPRDYNRFFWRWAGEAVLGREIDVPDRTLGVGPWEVLAPQPRQDLVPVRVIERAVDFPDRDLVHDEKAVPKVPDQKAFAGGGWTGPALALEEGVHV